VSVSGVVMESGSRARVDVDGQDRAVNARTGIASSYVRYEVGNWSFMGLGTLGWMQDTRGMFELTRRGGDGPQVLGARTYGYYVEVGCDVLPYLRKPSTGAVHTLLYRSDELKVPIFARYERLDTHAAIDPVLAARLAPTEPVYRSNLDVVTLGANVNLRRNLVLKANYQIRRNRARSEHVLPEGDQVSAGLGFIF
jgi:hypothetical protein